MSSAVENLTHSFDQLNFSSPRQSWLTSTGFG
jgi:hypothetical protein